MKVAIDGPAGSGKSTVAHEIARRRHLTYLDTGAMYRAVTLACLRRGVDLADEKAVTDVAESVSISFEGGVDDLKTLLDGDDVSTEIRTAVIDRNVSVVSAYPGVRAAMVKIQQAIGASGDVIAEGRDIGTVVFPDAEVKVFLTADASARAHRRAVQRTGQDASTNPEAQVDAQAEAEVLADLERRDRLDSTRATSPLKAADDAHRIDSSNLTVDEVCDQIEHLMDLAVKDKQSSGAQDPQLTTPTELVDIAPASRSNRDGKMPFFGNEPDAYYANAMMSYPWITRGFYYFAAAVVWCWTKLWWRWDIQDADKLLKSSNGRGAVVIMNHTSMLDPCIVVLYELFHHRRLRPIYKSEFDEMPFIGWFLTRIGCISIHRGEADLKALRYAQHALERGESILIYPEGTRVKSDSEEVKIHGGFALIAQMAKADIIPVGIVGARDITPRGKHLFHPGKVFVQVGEPIKLPKVRGKDRKRVLQAAEDESMRRVYELRDDLRRRHPGKM